MMYILIFSKSVLFSLYHTASLLIYTATQEHVVFRSGQSLSACNASTSSEENRFLRDFQLGLRLLVPPKSLVAFPAGVDCPELQSTIIKVQTIQDLIKH